MREKHGSFCRCKNSKCLKRYCECFERGVPCGDTCACENCENVPTLERYVVPFAVFARWGGWDGLSYLADVADSAPLPAARAATASQKPTKKLRSERVGGCNCKNSRCLKLYCVCFKAGSECVAACKCVDCQNGRPADAPVVEAIAARPKKRLKASSQPSRAPLRTALAPVPFKRGPWRRLLVPIAAPPKKRRRTSLD